MAAKKPIMIHVSDEMRAVISKAAKEEKVSMSELIRVAIADHIGYDLASEPKTGRPRVYASDQERKAAQKARARKKRELVNKVLAAFNKDLREEDLIALVESLENRVK